MIIMGWYEIKELLSLKYEKFLKSFILKSCKNSSFHKISIVPLSAITSSVAWFKIDIIVDDIFRFLSCNTIFIQWTIQWFFETLRIFWVLQKWCLSKYELFDFPLHHLWQIFISEKIYIEHHTASKSWTSFVIDPPIDPQYLKWNCFRGCSQIMSRKKLLFRPPPYPLSQIFQKAKKFVFGLSQILQPPPPKAWCTGAVGINKLHDCNVIKSDLMFIYWRDDVLSYEL